MTAIFPERLAAAYVKLAGNYTPITRQTAGCMRQTGSMP